MPDEDEGLREARLRKEARERGEEVVPEIVKEEPEVELFEVNEEIKEDHTEPVVKKRGRPRKGV